MKPRNAATNRSTRSRGCGEWARRAPACLQCKRRPRHSLSVVRNSLLVGQWRDVYTGGYAQRSLVLFTLDRLTVQRCQFRGFSPNWASLRHCPRTYCACIDAHVWSHGIDVCYIITSVLYTYCITSLARLAFLAKRSACHLCAGNSSIYSNPNPKQSVPCPMRSVAGILMPPPT